MVEVFRDEVTEEWEKNQISFPGNREPCFTIK